MKIIRDDQLHGFAMLPLFFDWNVRRCNITNCKNQPSTILTQVHPEAPGPAGLCEEHYQEFLQPGGHLEFQATMEWDDYNSFE